MTETPINLTKEAEILKALLDPDALQKLGAVAEKSGRPGLGCQHPGDAPKDGPVEIVRRRVSGAQLQERRPGDRQPPCQVAARDGIDEAIFQ